MPLTLPAISRRRFMSGAITAGAAAFLSPSLFGEEIKADANDFLLFSDIHLPADQEFIHKSATGSTNPWVNFQQAAREAMALPAPPRVALINGDIACRKGLAEDYATATLAMKPLRDAGVTVHWALGNHDNRVNAAKAAADDAIVTAIPDRRVMILSAPRANLFVLDSLQETDKTPGLLGTAQIAWLEQELDRHADRPAIVFVHHPPYLGGAKMGDGSRLDDYVRSQKSLESPAPAPDGVPAAGAVRTAPRAVNTSLLDTVPLLELLLSRKHVKAYFFGHTHEYSHKTVEGLHLVNLPAIAWIFKMGQPLGWMDMRLEEHGAKLQLHSLDPKHPLHGDQLDLRWRA